mgnify:CR=1 FL=1
MTFEYLELDLQPNLAALSSIRAKKMKIDAFMEYFADLSFQGSKTCILKVFW